jgi:ribose/xylose/arabinose/galactoside ABC-type transport system permease subunit
MATIARLLARRVPATQAEADILKQIALFCCAGLLVSLLMMTYGVDLSPGFF